MKNSYFYAFIIIFAIGFIYGLIIDMYEIFPYDLLRIIKSSLSTSNDSTISTPSTYNFNPESIINIKNISELEDKKNRLVQTIWKDSSQLSNLRPKIIEKNFLDERYSELTNLKTISKLTIEMDNKLTSIVYLFEPVIENNELVIYHQGHRGDFIQGKNSIELLLENGYSVAAFSMPLMGMNNQPIVITENYGPVLLNSHNKFQFLETNDFSPIKYFVEPIFTTLNYVNNDYSFSKIHFIGISGGGWTGILYSSIDDRILNTFSTAGSLPIFLRSDVKDIGDYEQTNFKLLSIANYLEMYVMSSYGENRKTILIYNEFDPCCFAGKSSLLFEESIQNKLNLLGNGFFDIIIDEGSNKHEISNNSLNEILELMK